MNAPKEYALADWLRDYEWFLRESDKVGPHSASMEFADFRRYFDSTRSDPIVALYCCRRFVAALTYLEENRHAIDFGKAGVVGQDRILVNKRVIVTLYRFFAARPDYDIIKHIPVETFVAEIKSDLEL